MQGFPVRMTERDRWSSCEHSGYWIFNSNAQRAVWLNEVTKSRNGTAPDFYVEYTAEQPIELLKQHSFDQEGKFFARELFETRRIQLV